MSKIRVSAVSYTNTLPFLAGIKRSEILNQIDLSLDYPSECARKVIADEADLGIIPVAALSMMDEYHIITDYCIGANGPVDSVFIFSNKPAKEITTLRLDKQSRTSNGLAQILFKHYWDQKIEIVESDDADAYVLIGDRTFGKKDTAKYVYDLAEEWKEFTGLPFAFAVWVANKKLPEYFINNFNAALKDGVANPASIVVDLVAIPHFDFEYYLTQNLDFHLDAAKRQAIALYLSYYKSL